MKITIYAGNTRPEPAAIAELIKHIPEESKVVIVQATPRRAIDLRACQRPGHLEYVANCDDKVFLFLSQPGLCGPITVKVTT